MLCAVCVRRTTLRHVLVASATRAQLLHRFLHQSTHVISKPLRLRKHQRRLSTAAAQQGCCLSESHQFLGEQLDEFKVAIGEEFCHQLLPAACRMFRFCTQQLCSLQLRDLFQQPVLGFLSGFNLFQRFARLLLDIPDMG